MSLRVLRRDLLLAQVLASEGQYAERVNTAKAEAEAMLAVASATAESIRIVADAMQHQGGMDAVQLKVAEKYLGKPCSSVLCGALPAMRARSTWSCPS